jgi:hypothetical protein
MSADSVRRFALDALAGFSGFAVCLGTALIGLLLLPVVYLWARDLGGPRAGAAALLVCAVGPSSFFRYMVSPRGGYAVALLAGLQFSLDLGLASGFRGLARFFGREACFDLGPGLLFAL